MSKYDEFMIIGYNPDAVFFTDWNCGYYQTLERALTDTALLQVMYPEDVYTAVSID